MTGARSRARGHHGEQALARWLAAHGWPDATSTRNAQGGGGTAVSDITATDLPWSIECKNAATPQIATWWAQTVRQAAREHRPPLLVWHPMRWSSDPGTWLTFRPCGIDTVLDDAVVLVRAGTPTTLLAATAAAILDPAVGQNALHWPLTDDLHLIVSPLTEVVA